MKSVLNDILIQTGMSRYQIATQLGISKSYVLSVFSGTKNMSENMFTKMMAMDEISIPLRERLAQSYYRASFGEEGYALVLHYLACGAAFTRELSELLVFEGEAKLPAEGYISGEERLIAAAVNIVKNAKEKGLTVYTNYPFKAKKLNDALFAVCKGKDGIKTVDFCHMIYTEPVCNREAVTDYWQILRWGFAGIETAIHPEKQAGGAFPWILFSGDLVLLFDDTVSHGIFSKSSELAQDSKNEFTRQYEKAERIVHIIEDETKMLFKSKPFSTKKVRVIDGCLCPLNLMDKEMLMRNTTDFPIEEKEYLINAFLSYYQHSSVQIYDFMVTDKALIEWAKTGRLSGVSEHYLKPFGYADRALVLERFENSLSNNKKVLNQASIEFPFRYTMESDGDFVMTHFLFDGSVTSPYEIYVDIRQNAIANLSSFCENLFTYCSNRSFLYNMDQLRFLLDQMILQLKAKAKFEEAQ